MEKVRGHSLRLDLSKTRRRLRSCGEGDREETRGILECKRGSEAGASPQCKLSFRSELVTVLCVDGFTRSEVDDVAIEVNGLFTVAFQMHLDA